eukprot:1158977-Pelagomonas_calceolata.AAC.8
MESGYWWPCPPSHAVMLLSLFQELGYRTCLDTHRKRSYVMRTPTCGLAGWSVKTACIRQAVQHLGCVCIGEAGGSGKCQAKFHTCRA